MTLPGVTATLRPTSNASVPERFLHDFFRELELLTGRKCEMSCPVDIRVDQRHRREPDGEACQCGMRRPIDDFCQRRRGKRVAQQRRARRLWISHLRAQLAL